MTSVQKTHPVEGQGELVLVVDDDDLVRMALRHSLVAADYAVATAANGAEAYEAYRQHAEDVRLIVTDAMMPVMGGLELIQKVRGDDPQLPMILISGVPSQSHCGIQAANAGVRFLQKPFRAEMLLGLVGEMMARCVGKAGR